MEKKERKEKGRSRPLDIKKKKEEEDEKGRDVCGKLSVNEIWVDVVNQEKDTTF